MFLRICVALTFAFGHIAAGSAFAQLSDARLADYEQWRMALKSGAVADPAAIATLPGFKIELVHVARPLEGSWISLTFDPRGRIVIGREDKGLLRLTLAEDRKTVSQVETIDETLLECRGLLFAHESLYVHANNSKGLYRLRDTDGDDRFDDVRLLRRTEGGVGHGRNGLALGPDGMIYLAMGNNVEVSRDCDAASPYRGYANDRLLPCAWNEFLFDADVVPPCGHVVRTDADGKQWELFAGGFRNPYGIAFNRDGELFTYDADMEWDAGAPWYRPTCVMHVVSGGEYGWRQETNCWPDYFPDSLPRAVDIGLGSPTGVKFGDKSRFGGKYAEALYILDWAYGRIIAVHLAAHGASYTGAAETFIKGRPLNVTDLDFGPDGAMYFVVGGRRTQSALYRVTQQADSQADRAQAAAESKAPQARSLRHMLAKHQGSPHKQALEALWPSLSSGDRWLRQAARVALERQPVESWRDRALAESDPAAAGTALVALARVGKPEWRVEIFSRIAQLATGPLEENQRLAMWRTLQLAIIRHGAPGNEQARQLVRLLAGFYRTEANAAEREMLCELLVALEWPDVVGRTLAMLDAARTQEEKLFYIFALRDVKFGWTIDQREQYFRWLKRAEAFSGAHYLHRFLTFIRTDALLALPEEDRKSLAPLIERLGKVGDLASTKSAPRPEVHKWTLDELTIALDSAETGRDFARGKRLYVEAQCARCHRLRGVGQPIGPDLDGASSRFGRRDLLEAILLPSKVVDEKYRNMLIETDSGQILNGQLAGGDAATLVVAADPLEPSQLRRVPRKSIVSRRSSPVSIMPEGLLNTLERDEILDLLLYLEAPEGQ
ncbi:MAG TPA: c-type cytochrome [Planctomycetaceae bacterium]|nr:c-type cytochrome [Planctomycetaceae bacterium]